jgi:hypothetical protein
MGLWARIEKRMWTGKVLREFPLSEGTSRGVTRKVSALLTDGHSGRRFIIRSSFRSFLSGSVQFVDLDRDEATRLKAALDQALAEMR